jgi:O-antigen ligase
LRSILPAIALAAVALLTGALVAGTTPAKVLVCVTAALIFTASFVKVDWGLYILIFSMLLSPEVMAGATVGGSLGRGVTLRLEDFLLVLIGLSWLARNAVMKDLGLFLKTSLNRPIFIYMVVCALSTTLGIMAGRVDPKTGALYVLKYFEYFIVFFMLVNHVRDVRQLKRFVFCLFLTAAIVSLIGIAQIPDGSRLSAPFEGPGGEPNTFGGYLLFVGMVAAGLAAKVRERRTRHLLLLLIVCLLPPFFFTQSRSSYLAFVPALLVLGFMTERRLIIVGLLSVALLASPLFLPQVVKERILYTFNQPEEPGQITIGELRLDTSTSARLQSWQDALRDFPEHPFLGHGVTGYAFVDAQLPRVLTETGILGLAAFIYLLVSVFRLLRSRLRQTEDPFCKGLIMGFTAGFVGLLVHSIGTNTFIIVRIMEPFWFFVGIVAVMPATVSAEQGPAAREVTGGRGQPRSALSPRGFAARPAAARRWSWHPGSHPAQSSVAPPAAAPGGPPAPRRRPAPAGPA